MTLPDIIFITFIISVIVGCMFMVIRAEWVYRRRIEIIDNNFEEYHNYLTFEEMMKKFWIWDIEKLRKPKA
jgi:hypothetical protein